MFSNLVLNKVGIDGIISDLVNALVISERQKLVQNLIQFSADLKSSKKLLFINFIDLCFNMKEDFVTELYKMYVFEMTKNPDYDLNQLKLTSKNATLKDIVFNKWVNEVFLKTSVSGKSNISRLTFKFMMIKLNKSESEMIQLLKNYMIDNKVNTVVISNFSGSKSEFLKLKCFGKFRRGD